MRRHVWVGVLAVMVLCVAGGWTEFRVNASENARVMLHFERQSGTDLIVSGKVAGLGPHQVAYVRREELRELPQVQAVVADDEDMPGVTVHVRGVALDVLARALGAEPPADLIDMICSDGYRAYYPREMVDAHRPILVLDMDGMAPAQWAVHMHRDDPGPYLVLYDRFRPGWQVLAHMDRPQLPTNVVGAEFASERETLGRIEPPPGSSQMAKAGYRIARQNCIRCHNEGTAGGTKSGIAWERLGDDARRRPDWFARVVRDPKSIAPGAEMPGNPEYDDPTTAALAAYFSLFRDGPSAGVSGGAR